MYCPAMPRPLRHTPPVLLLALLATLAACDGGGGSPDMAVGSASGKAMEPAPAAPPMMDEASARDMAQRQPPVAPGATDSVPPQMLIRTGDARIEVEELEPAVAAATALARRVGGHVANTSYLGGRDQVRTASLELKIPAARFHEVQDALDSLGTVEWFNVAVEDVGEQYVDLEARLANARRLEARLVELLATRTGRLEDVLAVERELARVRGEIETVEGRMRYLRSRVALSTLTVQLHEPEPIIGGSGGGGVIGEAFRNAWRNFVHFVAAFIASAGVWIPLLVVGALAVWGARRWRRT